MRAGFEPANSKAERIYSPRPLATWIPHLKKFGRRKIRTFGTIAGSTVFKTAAIGHSAILPIIKTGPEEIRTLDLLNANQALFQLSYKPIKNITLFQRTNIKLDVFKI